MTDACNGGQDQDRHPNTVKTIFMVWEASGGESVGNAAKGEICRCQNDWNAPTGDLASDLKLSVRNDVPTYVQMELEGVYQYPRDGAEATYHQGCAGQSTSRARVHVVGSDGIKTHLRFGAQRNDESQGISRYGHHHKGREKV